MTPLDARLDTGYTVSVAERERADLGKGGNVYNIVKRGEVYEVEGPGLLASFIAIPQQGLHEASGEVQGLPFSGFIGNNHYSFLVLTPFPELCHGEYVGGMKIPFSFLNDFAHTCKALF